VAELVEKDKSFLKSIWRGPAQTNTLAGTPCHLDHTITIVSARGTASYFAAGRSALGSTFWGRRAAYSSVVLAEINPSNKNRRYQ
jgi:hypothetical protein